MDRKETLLQKNAMVCLLATVCCLLWGSAFPCIKIGYQLFEIGPGDTAAQIAFAGTRFFLAGILTILIGSVCSKKLLLPAKSSAGMIFRLSLAQTIIQYLLFYVGLAHTAGVKGSIISASSSFFAILISSLIFHYEKLTRAKVLGCLLGFAGVVVINLGSGPVSGSMSFLGEGFLLLSTLSSAVSSALIKKYSRRENPVVLSGFQFLLGGLVMAVAGLAMGGRLQGFTPRSVLLLIYMAMISAVAYSLWSILLKYNSVGKVAVFGFMNPVFGVILSAVLLGEQNQAFTLQGLAALLLVCAGIFAVNRQKA